jgi:hypothetical protein
MIKILQYMPWSSQLISLLLRIKFFYDMKNTIQSLIPTNVHFIILYLIHAYVNK